MIYPEPKDIAEIIKKLKLLKKKEVDFINKKIIVPSDEPVDIPFDELSVNEFFEKLKDAGVGYKILSVEEYMGAVVRAAIKGGDIPPGFTFKSKETPLEEFIGGVELFLRNRMSVFPNSVLQELLDHAIPKIYKGNEISITDGQGVLTEEGKRLSGLRDSIRSELRRRKTRRERKKDSMAKLIATLNEYEKIRKKPKEYWPKNILDLMNKIAILLFPYKEYFKENGSWGEKEQFTIEFYIEEGHPEWLEYVIQELEKIKFKMEIEAKQSAPQKPAKIKRYKKKTTINNLKDSSRVQIRLKDKNQLIGALITHHGIWAEKVNLKPATQKELEELTDWNQPKVSRMMETIFGENPMRKYKQCFAGKELSGYMKKLKDGTYEVDGIVEPDQE